jgi:ubiquinone/menaquinone biosynthesis C-methylase UbiE
MNDLSNSDMRKFWNGDGGLNWMRFQSRLEKSLTGFGEQAISSAKIARDERVLDVGCGWADTSFELAQRVGPNGYVRGIDISKLILKQARNRIDSFGLDNIQFDCVDAESHRFDSMKFDVIFSRFGVMFFNDPVAAFRNLIGALKPGGRIVFICWQSVKDNQWVNLPQEIVAKHVAGLEPVNPEAPGGFAFGDANRVLSILQEAGFVDIRVKPYDTKFNVGENLDEAITFLSHLGPASAVIEAPDLDSVIKNHIIADLRNELVLNQSSNGIELDSATWIFTAANG